jgi:phage tail sheath protein FI
MPNYLTPGVYVEEVSSGSKPIAGASTSIGAFVGLAERGTPNKPELITNWSQFVTKFGNFIPNSYLAYAVYSFFGEGGSTCYVVRAAADNAIAASKDIDCQKADESSSTDKIKVEARSEGAWGNRVSVQISDPSIKDKKLYFKMTVTYEESSSFQDEYLEENPEGKLEEIFDNISVYDLDEAVSPRLSSFVKFTLPAGAYGVDSTGKLTINIRPKNLGDTDLASGSEGSGVDFIGDASDQKGLHAFDTVDNINIVAIPDQAGHRDTILGALNYCKNRRDCFFIVDPPYGADPTAINKFKFGTGDSGDYKGNGLNSSYGALYYPWVIIKDPLTKQKRPIPPSGAVAGTYAYTDSTRGVHKAPAGINEGYLDTIIDIERTVTKGEQETLNPIGVNVIRKLPAGMCIWGARTLSADPEWLYVNVRRLFLFLEKSIDMGSQWVVFEPNTPTLWGSVKRNLTAFLTRVWRDGALFGNTPEEAFFVKVDEENNPSEVRDAGQLIIEVGVAPAKPAEFVVIRISQKTQSK